MFIVILRKNSTISTFITSISGGRSKYAFVLKGNGISLILSRLKQRRVFMSSVATWRIWDRIIEAGERYLGMEDVRDAV